MPAQSTLRHTDVGRVALAALLAVLLAWAAVGFAPEKAVTPDLSRMNQGNAWRLINADCDTALEDGKPVVHMRPRARVDTGSSVGLALVEGLEFGEGSLE